MRASWLFRFLVPVLSVVGFERLAEAADLPKNCDPPTAQGDGTKLALVIGNAAYKKPKRDALGHERPVSTLRELTNARSDAEAVSSRLRELGFTTFVCRDLDKGEMESVLTTYADTVRNTPNAVSVFYYAGHGGSARGASLLYGVDYQAGRSEAINVELQVVKRLEPLQLKESFHRASVVIVDACRTETVEARSEVEKARVLETPAMVPFTVPAGTYLVFSTGPDRNAEDSSELVDGKPRDQHYVNHSAFAGPFLRMLDEHPDEDIDQFFRAVRKEVWTVTDKRQVPWTSHSLFDTVGFGMVKGT